MINENEMSFSWREAHLFSFFSTFSTHATFRYFYLLNYFHHVISYIPYLIISYNIISYNIISYNIISYHIISYYIILYHIILYHIISYHIMKIHSCARTQFYLYDNITHRHVHTYRQRRIRSGRYSWEKIQNLASFNRSVGHTF